MGNLTDLTQKLRGQSEKTGHAKGEASLYSTLSLWSTCNNDCDELYEHLSNSVDAMSQWEITADLLAAARKINSCYRDVNKVIMTGALACPPYDDITMKYAGCTLSVLNDVCNAARFQSKSFLKDIRLLSPLRN